jgi:hypothetical protein
MSKYEELTLIAGILSITAFSFLVHHVYVTKLTDNLTYLWIGLNLVAQALLFTYGKINNVFGMYFSATIIFTGIIYIMYVKVMYTDTNKIVEDLKKKDILNE